MKDNKKELLYFLRTEKANFTTADKTDVIELIRLICKNVRTGEDTLLFSYFFPFILKKDNSDFNYYDELSSATGNFDILWDLTDKGINPISFTFEETQSMYHMLISKGIKENDVYSEMVKSLQNKPKSRVKSK